VKKYAKYVHKYIYKLDIIKKYNNIIDNDHLDNLKDDIKNNKNKRYDDFQKIFKIFLKKYYIINVKN